MVQSLEPKWYVPLQTKRVKLIVDTGQFLLNRDTSSFYPTQLVALRLARASLLCFVSSALS